MRHRKSSGHTQNERSLGGSAALARPTLEEGWGREDLAETLDAVGAAIFSVDLEGRCVFINRAACRVLGYSREECLGEQLHYLIHGDSCPEWSVPEQECRILKAMHSGSGVHAEQDVFRRQDGNSLPVEYSVHPVVIHGITRGAVINFADITAQKHDQNGARKSDEWPRFGQNFAGVGIFDVDLKTGKTEMSGGQLRLLGLDPAGERPSYQEWLLMIHPEDRERMDQRMGAVASGGHAVPEDYRIVRPDGSVHWLLTHPTVFVDEAGNLAAWLGSMSTLPAVWELKRPLISSSPRRPHR